MITASFSKELLPYLEKAIESENADMGTVQLFDPSTNTLKIAAQVGFNKDFLEHFKTAMPFDNSSCGRAAGIVSPVIISDVLLDIGYAPHRPVAKSAGFRSVKSVPIMGKNKQMLGILSTHYKEPKWNWETNKITDVLKELAKFLQSKSVHSV